MIHLDGQVKAFLDKSTVMAFAKSFFRNRRYFNTPNPP